MLPHSHAGELLPVQKGIIPQRGASHIHLHPLLLRRPIRTSLPFTDTISPCVDPPSSCEAGFPRQPSVSINSDMVNVILIQNAEEPYDLTGPATRC